MSRVTTSPSQRYFSICPVVFKWQHIWNFGPPSIESWAKTWPSNAITFQVPEGMVGPAVLGYTAPPPIPMFPGEDSFQTYAGISILFPPLQLVSQFEIKIPGLDPAPPPNLDAGATPLLEGSVVGGEVDRFLYFHRCPSSDCHCFGLYHG